METCENGERASNVGDKRQVKSGATLALLFARGVTLLIVGSIPLLDACTASRPDAETRRSTCTPMPPPAKLVADSVSDWRWLM